MVVHGPPGVGKTVTIRARSHALTAVMNTATGAARRGLFDLLDQNPTAVIVLDDIGSLMHDRNAMQILLAALGGEIGETREINWSKFGSDPSGDCIHFSGGIIAISNETLPDKPLCRALRSRVPCIEVNPTLSELRAVFREWANKGHRCAAGSMGPAECREVVDYVLDQYEKLSEDAGANQELSYRTVTTAYGDYLTCKDEKKTSWQQMVLHSVNAATFKAADKSSKKSRLELERIAFLKAYAENAKVPEAEQLSITQLAERQGIGKSKAYEFVTGK